MIEILRCSTHTRPKELSETDDIVTTSFPRGFSHEDAWVNAQLRTPSATTKYVVFISDSEFGSEPKSRSLSTQSERVTHLHIETHHKNPLDTLLVSTG